MRFLAALVCVLAVSAPVLDHAPAIAAPRSARSRAAGAEQPAPGSSANELRLRGAKGTRARAADPVTDILQLGGRAPSAPLTTRSNPLDLLPPSWSRAPKVAILGSSADEATIPPALTQKLRVLGTDIARRGSVLVNGACPGVPEVAARAARAAGGLTIGIAPASSLEEHVQRPKAPTESISILHFAGTGGGVGLIEREAAIVRYSDILVYVNGRSGTLGELTAGMYEPKVIALLEGSGGVAGGAQEHILPHIGQGDAVVVSDRDPRRLLEKAMRALAAQRSQAALTPTPSVSRPSAASAALPRTSSRTLVDRERSSRHEVFAFLGHETGMNREDRARVDQLSDLIARGHPGGRAPLVVVPTRSGLTSDVAQRIRSRGVTTIGISPAATLDQHLNAAYPVEGLDEIQLTGRGAGVGEFAAYRPVVEHAHVVFVAGGDHKTLAGTVFAMYSPTVVAVLETGGMSGRLREEILGTFDKPALATLIFDTDPRRLYQRALAAAAELGRARALAVTSPAPVE